MPAITRALFIVATIVSASIVPSAPAFAINTCDIGGQSVNPANGNTTAGKTGLMRCRDADSGEMQREEEVKDGKFLGLFRYYRNGQIEKEFTNNERGNREGVYREWDVPKGGPRVLVREETYRNGETVGVSRSNYASGRRRRLTFYGDDHQELASVEFNEEGKPSGLRCASRPVFGSDFDDRAACGFAGGPSTVTFYGGRGQAAGRTTYEGGVRRQVETLWDSGAVRNQRVIGPAGGTERTFAADGTKLHEVQWQTVAARSGGGRPQDVNVLDQEFHESGKLVHERRWTPTERGADLVADTSWYLNGQVKEKIQYVGDGGRQVRRETSFFDNGKPSTEGSWAVTDAYGSSREKPIGTHRSFDEQGRERSQSIFDDRGRLTREKTFDARGTVVSDDEVFEDGSRKAVGR